MLVKHLHWYLYWFRVDNFDLHRAFAWWCGGYHQIVKSPCFFGAFHQVVKIYTASTNMLKSQFFLPNMISVLLYFAYVRETLLILKKFIGSCSSFFSLSGYKITPSGQGNICVQDEGMVYLPNNPMLYWKKPII